MTLFKKKVKFNIKVYKNYWIFITHIQIIIRNTSSVIFKPYNIIENYFFLIVK